MSLQYSSLLNTSDLDADAINVDQAQITNLSSSNATISNLTATAATFGSLSSSTITADALNLTTATPSKPLKTDALKNVIAEEIDLSSAEVKNVLPLANGGTNNAGPFFGNRFIISSGSQFVEAKELKTGEILVGVTSNEPIPTTLQGTANQVLVSGTGPFVFSTPQDIATNSSVQFSSVSSLTGSFQDVSISKTLSVGLSGTITSLTSMFANVTNGNVTSLSATSANITTGSIGTMTSTTANITSLSAPTLTSTSATITTGSVATLTSTSANITSATIPTLSTTTASFPSLTQNPLKLNSSKNVISGQIALASEVSGILPIANGGTGSSTGSLVTSITGTANQVIVSGTSAVTLSTPQNIATTSDVVFSTCRSTSDTRVTGNNRLELGFGVTKEGNAGTISYQRFSGGLDIVGAGTNSSTRSVTFFAEGGITTNGSFTCTSQTCSGTVTCNKVIANDSVTCVSLTSQGHNSSGNINITSGGLFLPTSGGTASSLNYYEEASETVTFTFTGGSFTGTARYTRIGRMVNITWDANNNSGTATGTTSISCTIPPTRFRPTLTNATVITFPLVVTSVGSVVAARATLGASLFAITQSNGSDFPSGQLGISTGFSATYYS